MEFKKSVRKTCGTTYTAVAGGIDVRVNVCGGVTKISFRIEFQKYPGFTEGFCFAREYPENEIPDLVDRHLQEFLEAVCSRILSQSGIDANVRIETRKEASHDLR